MPNSYATIFLTSAISEANPYYVLAGVCCLLGILVSIHFARDHDSEEWKMSSLRAEESPEPHTAPNNPAAPNAGPFQQLMESPLMAFWVHPLLGFIIPVVAVYRMAPEVLDGARHEVALVFGTVFAWNAAFRTVFKFPLRLPVIPVPYTWVALPLTLVGIWHWVSGG